MSYSENNTFNSLESGFTSLEADRRRSTDRISTDTMPIDLFDVELEKANLDTPSIFKEPFSGNLYDRHYGAIPANPYANEAVRSRQDIINKEFAKLVENPPEELNIPEPFRKMLEDDYYINVQRRTMLNYQNFMMQLPEQEVSDVNLQEALKRTEMGFAETGDVIDVALNTSFSGLELGRVTHPYWQRIEHVNSLRLDVAAAIHERGGTLENPFKSYKRIKINPRISVDEGGNIDVTGLIVRYKKDIGDVIREDGKVVRVVERQIAAFRTDPESGFPQDIIESMKASYSHDTTGKKDYLILAPPDEKFKDYLKSSGCRDFVESLVQSDSTESFIIPESTTIFCYTEENNPKTSSSQKTRSDLAKTAFRKPDSDDGIAFYRSSAN